MELSVIIVNYNVSHFLEQCLISVRKAASKISCEVIVVDNNSADGSCSMVRSLFPEVKLIRNNTNIGFSAACNQAIKLSASSFVLLLNPDTMVEEDTFIKCLSFMDGHPEAGAIGVKMINGNGKLLPESKRALPTPATAFFKMSGLAWLFPKSRLFNRYYLGHLDNAETSEADVLSGAFMFIRMDALKKTGLLDESFFMYGEDIDLSYRIIKAGFKNYYFPEVRIIHYKGESTRKSDINYIIHFYKAMLIFIKKHFGNERKMPLLFPLQIAVYFYGFLTVCKSIFRKIFLPIADAIILGTLLIIIIPLWENYKFGGDYSYPTLFSYVFIPAFALLIVLSVFLAGGYKLPSGILKVLKGILFGTAVVFALYSLLPENYRFSRAIIVFGGVGALIIIPLIRFLLSVAGFRIVENPMPRAKKTVIVAEESEYENIRMLLSETSKRNIVTGRVSINPEDIGIAVLGNIDQITEVVRINRVNEIVFSTSHLSASQIITVMHQLAGKNVIIKLAPPGEKTIIGSNSVNFRS